MKFVRMVMDDEDTSKAKLDEQGRITYICPVCGKHTKDVVEVYHGNCHNELKTNQNAI